MLAAAWLDWTNVARLEQNRGMLGSEGSRMSAAARAVGGVVIWSCGHWLQGECNGWDRLKHMLRLVQQESSSAMYFIFEALHGSNELPRDTFEMQAASSVNSALKARTRLVWFSMMER